MRSRVQVCAAVHQCVRAPRGRYQRAGDGHYGGFIVSHD